MDIRPDTPATDPDTRIGADAEQAYRALLSRDARFDGRLYVGVTTTGIYCRPICRVRAPRASSCQFFASAAAAEHAGFRPCLRCRPELAPGWSAMDAGPVLAVAAARLLEQHAGALDMPGLARRVGVGERHLRRIFVAHYGVVPSEYALTRRLLLAKQVLTETTLTVLEVAMLAGFGSVRRLNAVFRERYRMTPGDLRRRGASATLRGDPLTLRLDYRPPLDLPRLLAFFTARAVPGVEQVDAGVYRRTLVLQDAQGQAHAGWIEVQAGEGDRLQLRLADGLRPVLPTVLAAVRRQFDLDADPVRIAQALGSLAVSRPGLRLPGAMDPFEQAVRAILGQQVSVAAATTLAGRIAMRCGTPLPTPFAALSHLFPAPTHLAELPLQTLRDCGVLATRARSIHALAQAVVEGRVRWDGAMTVPALLQALQALPGIGEWTAQYIALRCLSWPDAFPHTDLIVRRAFPGHSPQQVLAHAERWRPWRGYATLHLWQASADPTFTLECST